MEIKKVEEINLTNDEDTLWVDFYELVAGICNKTADIDIEKYCADILTNMENLGYYLSDK